MKNFASPIEYEQDSKCSTTLFLSKSGDISGTIIQYASPCKISEKGESTKEYSGLDNEYIILICEL